MRWREFSSVVVALSLSPVLGAQEGVGGDAVFEAACAVCHSDAGVVDAPGIELMREFPPGAIVNSLVNGKMQVQGAVLSEEERIAVAEFIAGRPVDRSAAFFADRCPSAPLVTALDDNEAVDEWREIAKDLDETKQVWCAGTFHTYSTDDDDA